MKYKQKTKTLSSSNNTLSITYITESTEITADMKCDIDIRIAGSVEGEVESKQKVILTKSGKIDGALISDEADISGNIKGDIKISNKLILRSTAVVDGEVYAKKLVIEEGAQLQGSLQVSPVVKEKENIVKPTGSSKLSV